MAFERLYCAMTEEEEDDEYRRSLLEAAQVRSGLGQGLAGAPRNGRSPSRWRNASGKVPRRYDEDDQAPQLWYGTSHLLLLVGFSFKEGNHGQECY
jgi:hypothetical protein